MQQSGSASRLGDRALIAQGCRLMPGRWDPKTLTA